ncbi:hypothetical protein [Deinococcus soli (ex Cha et al. 2016)]|uniref:hypothetical protein n=1 Tax=Deinococcus soli (ex Cha et al. 2016) TaxID=1309411 RepID=UPI001664CFF9|nr:hypothetical protein [Deinococcus soli (ex Cha et al. 2016)]GGB69111.1 hypothetical protein GCM10008019_26660 [Deinococcus soli (ex Cha et al. 2016)]
MTQTAPEITPEFTALERVTAALLGERERRITVEGWDPEHDAGHTLGELAEAAAAYIVAGTLDAERTQAFGRALWPWEGPQYRPRDLYSNLVRGGALLMAELTRLVTLADTYSFWWVDETSEVYAAVSREALDAYLQDLGITPIEICDVPRTQLTGVNESGSVRRPAWQALIDAIGHQPNPLPAFQIASYYN